MLGSVARLKFKTRQRFKSPSKKPSEQGLTLLESLVAIVIISIVVSSVTPPIFLAVATRAQNQKAEQAMQLAQGEIDRIRTIVERGEGLDKLPPLTNQELKDVGPPSGVVGGDNEPNRIDQVTSFNQAFWIDADRNGKWNANKDFFVQSFRGKQITRDGTASSDPISFQVGVRVYAGIAKGNSLKTAPASLKFTTAQGSQKTNPLAVLYTQMTRSETGVALCRYREFIKGSANDCGR